MKKWIFKAILQKIISFLPQGHRINFLFQKYVTRGVILSDEYFTDKLRHAGDHLDSYRKYSRKDCPEVTLELGTGWYPVVPLCMFLSGSKHIYTLDITPLVNAQRIKKTINKFLEFKSTGQLDKFISIHPERWKIMEKTSKDLNEKNCQGIMRDLNIHYIIGDASQTNLNGNVPELIHSNNTLEHIYPHKLKEILKKFHGMIQKPGGIMSHFIDMSDHFAHSDKSISEYHFLRFSDRQWKWIDNSIQPQNRLRISDYIRIYEELNIPVNEVISRPGNPDMVRQLPLSEKFRKYFPEDLAVTHSRIVSYYE